MESGTEGIQTGDTYVSVLQSLKSDRKDSKALGLGTRCRTLEERV